MHVFAQPLADVQRSKRADSALAAVRHVQEQNTSAAASADGGFRQMPRYLKAQLPVQPKLAVNQPDDVYEREADRAADRVLHQSEPPPLGGSASAHRQSRGYSRLPAAGPGSQGAVRTDAPAAVCEAIRTPGQPLDPAAQEVMEARLGADLSAVAIHTGAAAGASAHALRARAFTVGQHIAFAPGRYAPHTVAGKQLLAHELVHTIQQREVSTGTLASSPAGGVDRVPGTAASAIGTTLPVQRQPDDFVDVDLEPVSPAESERLRRQGVQLPTVGAQTWAAVGGAPYSTILPGYSQLGDTCGAASLVSALLIWDREHWDAAQPNSRIVDACNLILTEFARHGSEAVQRWAARPAPEVRRTCGSDDACVTQAYSDLRQRLAGDLQRIRDAGRQPGAVISETDYQTLGVTLYFLWRESGARGSSGLSAGEIERIQRTLGLYVSDPSASGNVQSYDEIFASSILVGLEPDQFAQVAWFVNTGAQHAFLIGRLQSGAWFLSDQGPSPASEFRAPSLNALRDAVRFAATSGTYWLFVGTSTEYINRFGFLPGWTGVRLLASASGTQTQLQNLVAPGAFLGEVDAGYLTIGQRLTNSGFVSRRDNLADAQAQFSNAGGGGLIVEMPSGVFSLYNTSEVSDANVSQTILDAADSEGGVLMRHTFFHTWLILGTSSGRHGAWFRVY